MIFRCQFCNERIEAGFDVDELRMWVHSDRDTDRYHEPFPSPLALEWGQYTDRWNPFST